jgi:hypothetical protein
MDFQDILQFFWLLVLLLGGVAYIFYLRSNEYKSKQDSPKVLRLYCDKFSYWDGKAKKDSYTLTQDHISMEVFYKSKIDGIKKQIELGNCDKNSYSKHLKFLRRAHELKLEQINDSTLHELLNVQIHTIDSFVELLEDSDAIKELSNTDRKHIIEVDIKIDFIANEINFQLKKGLTVAKILNLFEGIGYVESGIWIENKMFIGQLIEFLMRKRLFIPAISDHKPLSIKFAKIFSVSKSHDQIRKNITRPDEGLEGVFCELFRSFLEVE